MMIWHITSPAAWASAQGSGDYRPASLDTEGFIHCSTTAQIAVTADRFYAGQRGLIALAIDPDQVQAPIRYEDFNVGDLFPHIYGPLNLDAVQQAIAYEPGADGHFSAPILA